MTPDQKIVVDKCYHLLKQCFTEDIKQVTFHLAAPQVEGAVYYEIIGKVKTKGRA